MQKQNPVGSTNTHLPPSCDRSLDLPMMRYDLPCFKSKRSRQIRRAKNGLTFPSTFLSSVPTGQNRNQVYQDVQTSTTVQELHALKTCISIYFDGQMGIITHTFSQHLFHLHVIDGRVHYQIYIQYCDFINCQ